jgi:large subunit ribosomal protein L3
MVKEIIGRKLEMTQLFAEDGTVLPVTLIEAGPCIVTQVKTPEIDGYSALQIGFGKSKPKNVNKPQRGHLDKVGKGYFETLHEVRTDQIGDFQTGQELSVDVFAIGEFVDVTGISKGKGFSGTIRRWNFQRGPAGHGSKNIREPGSTGNATYPGRVIKGKKMPGQKGNKRITLMGLKIVDIRPEENLLIVKGAVPGSSNGIIYIRKNNRVK